MTDSENTYTAPTSKGIILDDVAGQLLDLCNAQRAKISSLQLNLALAYQQLSYLWEKTGSCPCGARRESLDTHPHVICCPTAKATE